VGVSVEIGEHLVWPGKGAFGVNHPVSAAFALQEPGEGGLIDEVFIVSEEL